MNKRYIIIKNKIPFGGKDAKNDQQPGNPVAGHAALCRWGLAWLSIGLFTLLAGINLLRTALMERILLVAQCIVLAVWALPNGAAGLNGMAALKTLVLRLRGGQEKKANAV